MSDEQQALINLDPMDALEFAWSIICNASGGDWTKESAEWQGAAARLRTQYHAILDARQMDAPMSPPKKRVDICMGCDGTGWCEGSPAFTCNDCGGSGTAPADPPASCVEERLPNAAQSVLNQMIATSDYADPPAPSERPDPDLCYDADMNMVPMQPAAPRPAPVAGERLEELMTALRHEASILQFTGDHTPSPAGWAVGTFRAAQKKRADALRESDQAIRDLLALRHAHAEAVRLLRTLRFSPMISTLKDEVDAFLSQEPS